MRQNIRESVVLLFLVVLLWVLLSWSQNGPYELRDSDRITLLDTRTGEVFIIDGRIQPRQWTSFVPPVLQQETTVEKK